MSCSISIAQDVVPLHSQTRVVPFHAMCAVLCVCSVLCVLCACRGMLHEVEKKKEQPRQL